MPEYKYQNKIPVGISSYLLGEAVRYDGGHKRNAAIIDHFYEHFEFLPYCPEVEIGLGVPREPLHLIDNDGLIRCVNIENPSLNVTDQLKQCANQQASRAANICAYIFKARSPSCGLDKVKVYGKEEYRRDGIGIFAARIKKHFPHLPVADESQLETIGQRKIFLDQVLRYQKQQGPYSSYKPQLALTKPGTSED